MKIIMFYHSLLSDWNHGNAHYLRGIVTELLNRGNTVKVYEPEDSWSRKNLIDEYGEEIINEFHEYYPWLESNLYREENINLDEILSGADLVIVHEWNSPKLVKQIGEKKKKGDFKLLFHDTHHRAVTNREAIKKYDLSNYEGVLAFGEIIKEIYLQEGWTSKAFTWHEAADTKIFFPHERTDFEGDLVWIGNWGDEERSDELREFLIEPVKELKLKCKIFGVRYPECAKQELADAGIEYGGWLPNYKVPEVFSKYRFTMHVPRRPYVKALPGIPTIRPFEAMACGIPLLSAPWNDAENLFEPGKDFLFAQNGEEMKRRISELLNDYEKAEIIAEHGLNTIRTKHTCKQRVDQLYNICEELGIKNKSTIIVG